MRTLLILPAIALAGCASPQPPSCEHPDRIWDVTCTETAAFHGGASVAAAPKVTKPAPNVTKPAQKPQENKPIKPDNVTKPVVDVTNPKPAKPAPKPAPTPPEHHAPAENPPHIDGPNVDLPSVPDPDGDVTPGQPPEKPSKPDKAKKDKRDHHHATKRNASEHNRKGGNDGSGGKHRDGSRNSDKGKRK